MCDKFQCMFFSDDPAAEYECKRNKRGCSFDGCKSWERCKDCIANNCDRRKENPVSGSATKERKTEKKEKQEKKKKQKEKKENK